jgi:hypothetical protein
MIYDAPFVSRCRIARDESFSAGSRRLVGGVGVRGRRLLLRPGAAADQTAWIPVVLLFCCCSHRNVACGLSGSSPAQKVMPFFPRARRHGTSQILSGDDGGARPILYCVFVSVGGYLGSAVAYHVVGVIARLLPPPPWSGASSFVGGLLVGCVRHFPPAVVRGPTWS